MNYEETSYGTLVFKAQTKPPMRNIWRFVLQFMHGDAEYYTPFNFDLQCNASEAAHTLSELRWMCGLMRGQIRWHGGNEFIKQYIDTEEIEWPWDKTTSCNFSAQLDSVDLYYYNDTSQEFRVDFLSL